MLCLEHVYENMYILLCIYVYFVMQMYSLVEYSNNYCMTSERLWNYYRDEINNDENENDNKNRLNNNKTIASRSFKYKTKLIGSTPDNENRLNAEFVVS